MSKKELDENKINDDQAAVEEAETPSSGKHKKLKYGTMFYIIIALVVAVVVVMNIMLSVVAKRSPIKIDITPDDRYELSAESIDAVKSIDKDVDITVTAKRDYFTALANYWQGQTGYEIPFDLIPELLDKYSVYAGQGSGSINVKYVDMDVDPDIINQYKKYYSGDIERGSIIVSSGERVRVIGSADVMNMITPDQYTAQTTGEYKFKFTGESSLTAAINNVVDASPVKTAFAMTMNGASMFDAQSYGDAAQTFKNEILAKNGYDCTDIDIASDALSPEDYDMAVIFAPSVDFSEDVINKLSDFLYNGGKYNRNIVYIPDWTKTNLPNIEAFLADWNIKVENNIIVDDEHNVGVESNIALQVSDADAVGKLPNEKLPIVSPYTRELAEVSKNNGNTVKSIIKSYDDSYTVSITDKNSAKGEKGARNAVMLSQKQTSEDFNVYTSSLLVMGSPYMMDSTVIKLNTTYNNANVILSTLNTVSGKENGVFILDKSLQSSVISPTTKQAKVIQIIVVWVIPFIIAAVGVLVLLRRRNK